MGKKLQFSEKRVFLKGFTIIEILVAVTIVIFAMAGLYGLFLSQQSFFINQRRVATLQQNSRIMMNFLKNRISEAVFDPTEADRNNYYPQTHTETFGITKALSTDFAFNVDGNEDGQLTDTTERHRFQFDSNADALNYSVDDGTSWQTVGGPTTVGQVQNVNFGYFYIENNAGALTLETVTDADSNRSKIEVIKVDLTLMDSEADETIDLTSYIKLRNKIAFDTD